MKKANLTEQETKEFLQDAKMGLEYLEKGDTINAVEKFKKYGIIVKNIDGTTKEAKIICKEIQDILL